MASTSFIYALIVTQITWSLKTGWPSIIFIYFHQVICWPNVGLLENVIPWSALRSSMMVLWIGDKSRLEWGMRTWTHGSHTWYQHYCPQAPHGGEDIVSSTHAEIGIQNVAAGNWCVDIMHCKAVIGHLNLYNIDLLSTSITTWFS